MKAGVAQTVITPSAEGMFLIGPLAPSTGVHDDLLARVLVLDDGRERVVLVALDLLGMSLAWGDWLRQRIQDRAGVDAARIMLCFSHTHSAPLTIPWSAIGWAAAEPAARAWCEVIGAKVAQCVAQALACLKPAVIRSGREPVRVGCNRRLPTPEGVTMAPNPAGPVVPWTDVLYVTDAPGKPLALVFSHAAHPVIVHGASTLISADYPGYAVAEVRRCLGDEVVPMFVLGCAGDNNGEPLRGGFDAARAAGITLGAAAVRAAWRSRVLTADRLTCLATRTELPFRAPPSAEIEALLAGGGLPAVDLEQSGDDATKRWYDEDAVRCLKEVLEAASAGGGPGGLDCRVQGFAIGTEFCLVAMTHEPFADYQLTAVRTSAFTHTMVVGYVNGLEAYLPGERDLAAGGYETAPLPLPGAPLRYRYRRNLAAGVEDRLKQTIGALLERLAASARQGGL